MKIIYLLLPIFILGCTSINPRDQWIEEQVTLLEETEWDIESISSEKTMVISEDGMPGYHYNIGKISFEDNSWVYIFAIHSIHHHVSKDEPFIGNVILATDNKGRFYWADFHPGNGVLYTDGWDQVTTEEFFSMISVEVDGMTNKWTKIK